MKALAPLNLRPVVVLDVPAAQDARSSAVGLQQTVEEEA